MLRVLLALFAFVANTFNAFLRASGWPTHQLAQGAVTVVAKYNDGQTCIADIIATADGDTAAVVPHGLGNRPLDITITQILSQALTAESNWAVGVVDDTNINLTKLTSTGSGNAAAQLRVIARKLNAPVR